MTEKDCLFCKIIAGEIPSDKVHEDDQCIAFRDISPQAPCHVLVVPKKHISTLSDLTDADSELAGHLVVVASKIATEEGGDEKGYRLVWNCGEGAGQTVFHIHLHLLSGRGFKWPPG
jgi:histidine triad (HIT) family protein